MLLLPIQLLAQLKASADGHYLTEQDGTPVLLVGSAPWAISNLTYHESKIFADSCAANGINYWQIFMPGDALLGGAENAYGVKPWQGTQTFSSTPTEAYWAHLDSIFAYAKTKGIYVMLYPAYLFDWSTEVGNSTLAQMNSWGQYIGVRYKNFTNLLWGMAGDTDPVSVKSRIDTLADGIRFAGANQLISTRDRQATTTNTHWGTAYEADWGNFLRGTYPYWDNYEAEKIYIDGWDFYNQKPHRPAVLQEAWFENEHNSTQTQLRQQAYYAILSGLLGGQIFGNCPEWNFGFSNNGFTDCQNRNWIDELNSQGHKNQKWFARLFNSRYWWKLIPDSTNQVMIAGYGTVGQRNYVTTASANDGSSVIAYLPSQSTAVTINPATLVGDSVRVCWFDPSNGAVIFDGTQDTGTAFQVTPPSAGDWVLVVDSKKFDEIFDKPGGRAPQDVLVSVGSPSFRKTKFSLAQNYPNPFNPGTTIVYSLPSAGFVELIIFNVDGRKVATLVRESQQPGNYSVKFNAGTFASGFYFCKLQVNDLSNTIKILVLK